MLQNHDDPHDWSTVSTMARAMPHQAIAQWQCNRTCIVHVFAPCQDATITTKREQMMSGGCLATK